MMDLRNAGILVTGIWVDPISNRLVFGVADVTDQEAALLANLYGGPRVKVVRGVSQHFQDTAGGN